MSPMSEANDKLTAMPPRCMPVRMPVQAISSTCKDGLVTGTRGLIQGYDQIQSI